MATILAKRKLNLGAMQRGSRALFVCLLGMSSACTSEYVDSTSETDAPEVRVAPDDSARSPVAENTGSNVTAGNAGVAGGVAPAAHGVGQNAARPAPTSGGAAGAAGAPAGAAGAPARQQAGSASMDSEEAPASTDSPNLNGTAGASAVTPPADDLGRGSGQDVVLLGDSWMSNTLQFEGTGGGLVPWLINAATQGYRSYALQGVALLVDNFLGPAIPAQWMEAVLTDPNIATVIMTGGGNDVLMNTTVAQSCESNGSACTQTLRQVTRTLDRLWTTMADAGVKDIIYVRYSAEAGVLASLVGDNRVPMPPICASGRIRCHSFETSELLQGHLAADGLHPLQSGNQLVARALLDFMTAQGIRR